MTVATGSTVACAAGAGPCTARLVVTAPARRVKRGHKRTRPAKPQSQPERNRARPARPKPLVIATARHPIAAGSRAALAFRLNAAGRRLLRARRTLTATVTTTIAYAGAHTVTSRRRVVLRQPRPAGRRSP